MTSSSPSRAVPRRRSITQILAAVLLVAGTIFAGAAPAFAHDSLVSSTPEADTQVETLPAELSLTFSATLLSGDSGTAVEVTNPEGTVVSTGAPVVNGAVVTQALDTTKASAGDYTVTWRVVSSDGHPIAQQFTFHVLTATAPVPAPQETAEPAPAASESAMPTPAATPDTELAQGDAEPGLLPWVVIGFSIALIIAGSIIIARKRARLR